MLYPLPELRKLPTLAPMRQAAPGPQDVHLWHHEHATCGDAAELSSYLTLLPADERARHSGLRDERRQRRYLIGRALCRQALSHYASASPLAWQFTLGSRGKPSITAPALASPLSFNLSHSDTVSICAITGAGPEIGVDIEPLTAGPKALAVAEQFFPDAETTALQRLRPAHRAEASLRLWALKESLVKASEVSLADGLSGVSFDVSHPDEIDVTFDERFSQPRAGWHFRLLRLQPGHLVALAIRTDSKHPLHLSAGFGLHF